jgi:hypothetical protein
MVGDASGIKGRRERRDAFLFFWFFLAFYIGYLFYNPPSFSTIQDWIVIVGMIFFPLVAIFCFYQLAMCPRHRGEPYPGKDRTKS